MSTKGYKTISQIILNEISNGNSHKRNPKMCLILNQKKGMFFCVMRLYIVTKIRKVKKISTNNMVFFHIHMHKLRHYVYKKEDKRVRAVSARPENII